MVHQAGIGGLTGIFFQSFHLIGPCFHEPHRIIGKQLPVAGIIKTDLLEGILKKMLQQGRFPRLPWACYSYNRKCGKIFLHSGFRQPRNVDAIMQIFHFMKNIPKLLLPSKYGFVKRGAGHPKNNLRFVSV